MPMTMVFPAEVFDHTKSPFHEDTPWGRPTAVSAADEFARLRLIERVVDAVDWGPAEAIKVIREILSCPDLSKWEWPDGIEPPE